MSARRPNVEHQVICERGLDVVLARFNRRLSTHTVLDADLLEGIAVLLVVDNDRVCRIPQRVGIAFLRAD